MAPTSALDWSEPCQYWRYAKFCPGGQQQKVSVQSKAKSATDVSANETDSTYKRICKFLRRLGSKKLSLGTCVSDSTAGNYRHAASKCATVVDGALILILTYNEVQAAKTMGQDFTYQETR